MPNNEDDSSLQKPWPRLKAFLSSKPLLALVAILKWPRNSIRKMYNWVVGWSESKNAERALGGIAVAESSFFPIPPDPLLIAMTTVQPKKYLRFATICTVGSVIGGLIGYAIGVGLFESVGQWIINTYGLQEQFVRAGELFEANAFFAVLIAGFTPIPYKIIAISAGVFQINLVTFIIASIIGRGGRFFLVAFAMHHFGKRYKDKIEKYIDLLSLAFVALLILGFVALRYVF
jgi:membrane protein YqaA with SNARE-associated domain